MKILSISNVSSSRDRARLHLEDGSRVELAREVLMRAGLRAGDSISLIQLERLTGEDLRWRAREAALRLLSHRPRTESELRQRLIHKDFPSPVTEVCIEELREKGLLNDATFAEMFARDRIRLHPRGRRRVLQELRGRGVDGGVAAAAVDEVMREEEVEEIALAREAIRRRKIRPGEEPERARRRLTGFLARRGFSAETTREAVREAMGED